MTELTKDEIRMGDVVRLRNGATITVESIFDSYHDADGDHEGPFVQGRGTREYRLVSDVLEIAKRNDRICVFCGNGVTSPNPETDFCRNCHYTGANEERRLEDRGLLGKIREISGVESASVWHTGGGCFLLAVTLADGRFLSPSEGYVGDDGKISAEPTIPDPDGKWALVVSKSVETWEDPDSWDLDAPDDLISFPQALFSDAELVAAVARVAKGEEA